MRHRSLTIPSRLADTMRTTWNETADAFLAGLPALIEEFVERWGIRVGPAFEELSYHYVAAAVSRDGEDVVFKAGVPRVDMDREITAMRVYDGRGIARLLEADAARGVMLLERLVPGEMLTTVGDEERAVSIAADVMRRLWRPGPAGVDLPDVAEWLDAFPKHRARYGAADPMPPGVLDRAERLAADLLGSSTERYVLHGDLHHFNILSARRETWLAIDPHGVLGEREYEIGAFLRNPTLQPKGVTLRRFDRFVEELGLDRERARGWSYVNTVLSAVWTLEDSTTGWENEITTAGYLLGA
jgi:streptomycin 6-kinase